MNQYTNGYNSDWVGLEWDGLWFCVCVNCLFNSEMTTITTTIPTTPTHIPNTTTFDNHKINSLE